MNLDFGEINILPLTEEEVHEYVLLEGENREMEVLDDTTLSIRVDAPLEKFIKLYVNNDLVDSRYYHLSRGSTIITLSNDYLKSLNKTTYFLVAKFSDGDAKTSFTLNENTRVDATNGSNEDYFYHSSYYRYYYEENNSTSLEEMVELKEEEKVVSEVKKDTAVKEKETSNKEVKDTKKEINDEKKEFNRNYIPIIIVACAIVFGLFGGFLYKKSLDD